MRIKISSTGSELGSITNRAKFKHKDIQKAGAGFFKSPSTGSELGSITNRAKFKHQTILKQDKYLLKNTLISFFIILLLFSCCKKADQLPELTYNCAADAFQIKILKEELTQYEKENNISIKLLPFSGEEKLLSMMAANQEPDIFYTNNMIRDKLAAENRILDLRQFAEKDSFIKNIRPETIEQGKSIDGGWYHLCNWTYTFAVYYNKSLFQKQNIPFSNTDWTWEEMTDIAKKLTLDQNNDGKTDQWGIYIAPHFISALERMNHAGYKRGNLFMEIPDESIEAWKQYINLFKSEKVMPEIEKIESMGMQYTQLLQNGKIAMIVEALPNPDLLQILKIDWDILPLPKMNKKDPLYFRSNDGGLSIAARCKYPDKAWNFLKWLISKSSTFAPNPVILSSDFISGYEAKYPVLKNTNFRKVWELSEKHNGGDYRDFVRYSSWSAPVILERSAPVLENVLKGKEPIEKYLNLKDEINKTVIGKVKEYLQNPSIKKEFKEKIESALGKQS
jgi:ABC-type glycerol-3-phosphate transport system substrate-binding protein